MSRVPRSLAAAATTLGVGLGGFVDGIVLHQILQWHHLLSSTEDHPVTTVAGLEANTLADGLFHAFAWVAVVLGVALLWREASRGAPRRLWSSAAVWGWAMVGWGLFNLVEGLVNHHLLRLHHVRTDAGNVAAWDAGFLLFGALLVLGGLALQRSARPLESEEPATRPRSSSARRS